MMITLKSPLTALAVLALWSFAEPVAAHAQEPSAEAMQETTKKKALPIQYLEIVSSDVEATCNALTKVHGITFGKPIAAYGNARTAMLRGGGLIGVRAPMAEHEQPVVRPYASVDDIEAAIKAAEAAGGMFAMRTTEVPGGHGKFAIYFVGDIQHGLWTAAPAQEVGKAKTLPLQYLEIVNPKADATCNALTKVHGITFGEPIPAIGNARMATLRGGGRISVRAPMAEHEQPVVRPYALVDDIEAAIKAAEEAGAVFAMRATQVPGEEGKFAIYFLGGIQHGLWEL